MLSNIHQKGDDKKENPLQSLISCRFMLLLKLIMMNTHNLLSVKDIQVIPSIHYDHIQISEDVIPSKMIKICISTLNSDHMTPEEQSLGYFT